MKRFIFLVLIAAMFVFVLFPPAAAAADGDGYPWPIRKLPEWSVYQETMLHNVKGGVWYADASAKLRQYQTVVEGDVLVFTDKWGKTFKAEVIAVLEHPPTIEPRNPRRELVDYYVAETNSYGRGVVFFVWGPPYLFLFIIGEGAFYSSLIFLKKPLTKIFDSFSIVTVKLLERDLRCLQLAFVTGREWRIQAKKHTKLISFGSKLGGAVSDH